MLQIESYRSWGAYWRGERGKSHFVLSLLNIIRGFLSHQNHFWLVGDLKYSKQKIIVVLLVFFFGQISTVEPPNCINCYLFFCSLFVASMCLVEKNRCFLDERKKASSRTGLCSSSQLLVWQDKTLKLWSRNTFYVQEEREGLGNDVWFWKRELMSGRGRAGWRRVRSWGEEQV